MKASNKECWERFFSRVKEKEGAVERAKKDEKLMVFLQSTNVSKYEQQILSILEAIDKWKSKMRRGEKVTLFDCCCGKGIAGVVLAVLLSDLIGKVILFDEKENKELGELFERSELIKSSETLFQFRKQNLRETSWMEDFKEIKVLLLGFHLCGSNANFLIDCFNTFGNVVGLFLGPCCVGDLKGEYSEEEKKKENVSYEKWCSFLFEQIRADEKQEIKLFNRNDTFPFYCKSSTLFVSFK